MTLNAEQALIGALVINPVAVKDCGDLRPEMFTDELNGRLYLEFVRAYEFGYTANPVTFANNLPDIPKGELMNRLGEYMDASITSVAAGQYARAIIAAYKVREASRVINAVTFQPAGIERQIMALVNDLEAVRGSERTSAKSLAQIVQANTHVFYGGGDYTLNLRKQKDSIYSSFGRNEENEEAQGGKTE